MCQIVNRVSERDNIMFYLEDKEYIYPSRSVVGDVITREGPADENSFTPYDGYSRVIGEQFGRKEGYFNINDFLVYVSSQDFDPTRVKKEVKELEDGDIGGVSDKELAGFTTLESVDDDEYVRKHIRNLIVGYKKNRYSPYRTEELKDVEFFKDEETGDMISPAELVTRKDNVDLDYNIEIQKKFPYLLKLLHNGSVYYGIHLLSFMRAYEIIKDTKWGPADFGAQGVYKMERNGRIGRKFIHAEDNKVPDYYPFGRKWASGGFPDDMYYKAAQEFLAMCSFLNIDIRNENTLDYDKDYIDSIICTYVASNEEYVEGFGYVDSAIVSALSPENIFKSRNLLKKETPIESTKKSMNTMAELINMNLEIAKGIVPKLFQSEDIYNINNLFAEIARISGGKKYRVDDFSVKENLFVGRSGNYVMVNVTTLGAWDLCRRADGSVYKPIRKAVITYSGLLILVEDNDECFKYITCSDAVKIYRGEMNAGQWSTLRIAG